MTQGRYKNASEVIRVGLRLLEEEENKVQILKNAITEGIESGIAKDFNPKKHLETLKAKTKKAVDDHTEIYEYWSENQADKYYNE